MISSGSMPVYPAPGFSSVTTTHVDITTMMTTTSFSNRMRMLESGES
jgi:hypothetical protein